MALIFTSCLLYSYYHKPFQILAGYYVLSSFAFLVGFRQEVHLLVTYPIAAGFGMCVGAVVSEEVNPSYVYPHLGVVLFGLTPVGPTWVIFPLLYCAMAAAAGYKRLSAYSIPTLIVTCIISTQIGAAPLVALCCCAIMIVPFAILFPLFPKDVPFDVV